MCIKILFCWLKQLSVYRHTAVEIKIWDRTLDRSFLLLFERRKRETITLRICEHNCSINEFKRLGYERWLIYRQPCQDLDLSGDRFTRYSEKCFTQVCRALYGNAMLVPSNIGSNRNICHWVLPSKQKVITLKLRHIEINTSLEQELFS